MVGRIVKKRYNLRDVAHHAGVSVATVSRVLNVPDKVAPPTRERVETAMNTLRFVPSAAARAINSGRSRMVAALLPTLENSIYARVVDGLENRLDAHGLSLIVAQTGDDPKVELDRAKRLIDIGAEGLIVAGITHDDSFYDLIDRAQIPVVAVSYFDRTHRLPTIGYDNWEATHLAAQHLQDLGHRHVAVVHGPLAQNDRTQRRRAALESGGFALTFDYFEVPISIAGACAAVERLCGESSRLTAILCFSDVLAMGALAELHRQKVRVPRDMSVMGIEDLPGSARSYPRLTSVRLRVQEMGEEAAEALSAWVEHDRRPEPLHLASELIWRDSTAKPR
ncbi:LacI family DNA-binding transcriptional regulator [Yoonia sp. 2307UL14-13]|uniref:LacI family DNA-binding transcriptional regulator n=1 Tax=Yoonia sp. 2307UL14-13 TaxID=3126506 RepID=UPI0030AB8379